MIAWQGRTGDEVEGRIRECETTTGEVMSHPANSGLVFDGRCLDDVLMYELPLNGMQEPPTDGPVASSTPATRNPELFHKAFGNVH